jgi:hypothetical protein
VAINHNIAVFLKLAKQLGLEVALDDSNNPILEYEDKVMIYGVYMELISRHLKIKMDLIVALDNIADEQKGIERLRTQDEAIRQKREALDLEVELIAKSDYIENFQGRVQVGRQLLAEKFIEAQQQIPELLKQAERYVKSGGDVFSKLTIQIAGICSRFYLQEIRTQQEYVESYKKLKNLMIMAEEKIVIPSVEIDLSV